MIAFGIGCFHFGLHVASSGPTKASEYIKILKDSLGSIKSISSINVECAETQGEEAFELSGSAPDLGEGEGCYPYLDFFELSFEIYIPFRVQAEILECPEDLLDTTTERFRFKLINNFEGPVAFVECIGASRESKPSDAVVLMRRYLEKELEAQSTRIRLESLGPSPFHADFFLLPQQTQNNKRRAGQSPFQCSQQHQEGYDEVIFHYDSRAITTEQEAKEDLFQVIDSELDLFYEIRRCEVCKINGWEEIQAQLQTLLELQRAKGFRGRIKKLAKRGGLINELVCSLNEFNGQNSFRDTSLNSSHATQYRAEEHFLKHYVDEALKDRQKYPTSDVADLVKFIDERHGKTWQNFFVLIAAVLGGIMGSLVTISAQNWTPRQTQHDSKASLTNGISVQQPVTNVPVLPYSKSTNSLHS
jgi:hypothetical protein